MWSRSDGMMVAVGFKPTVETIPIFPLARVAAIENPAPEVPLVNFDVVTFEQFTMIFCPVMLALPSNIGSNRWQVRLAHRKGAVSVLPPEAFPSRGKVSRIRLTNHP